MRNHIIFKFLAIVLCAAALLAAVGGGLGIFVMTESELYEKSVDELYYERLENYALDYGINRWQFFASQHLGGASSELAADYYGNHWTERQFRRNRIGFCITDAEGNLVMEVPLGEGLDLKRSYEFQTDYPFMKVLAEVPYVEETPQETVDVSVPREEMYLYDAVPMGEKVDVYYMEIGFADGSSWGVENVERSIGYLRKSPNGAVEMLATVDLGDVDLSAYPVEILFFDREHNCLYQASNPNGVMESAEYRRGVGESFLMRTPQEIAGTAVSPTEPTIAEETVPVPEPTEETVIGENYVYYNSEKQQRMDVVYTMESAEGYTVHVMLAENPLQYDGDWMLVRLLYALRDYLPMMLIGGLILFAVTAVYLCCVAARKPKTDEVRPGGLNCIPLDLYAALVVGGEALLYILAYEALPELIHFNATLTALVGAVLAYCASLLIVGFCFACAAQFKTKGGYWWRHSLCGLCLGLAEKLVRWGFRLCKKLLPGIWRMAKAIFGFALTVLGKVFAWLKKIGKSLGKKLNRFYSLLPLTWQWVLVGSGLVLLIFLAAESRRSKWMLLSVLLGFALILYGAHCFGTLLEGVKGMRKGNLEEKVDDQLMTGSFKEFAHELNGLADVAVVAAQKQLKSERMKTELITNVSHDIKTPLTSIINYVDLLRKPHTEQEQEKYLEVLDRQSQRLKKLVEDLMEMSKASTGNLAVEIGRVDAAEAVNQALGEFADKLEKAELYPVFRQPEQPVYMLADGRLVWRVMSNLLSNAVKYALPGTRLYVDLQKLENKVILSIKNISREELNIQAEELLERFVRGDASRNTEGSGLGLNIAQSLMQLQKGQLQILVDGDLFKVTLIFPAEE